MNSQELHRLLNTMQESLSKPIRIMEVCGTHTQVIAKSGFSQLLEPNIHLVSGPGCPVCVTDESYIDAAMQLLQQPNTILVTFGDLMRVRGSADSLEDCMESKYRIKIVYSPFAALEIAAQNSRHQVVFLAVGFETTAPLFAAAAKLAAEKGLKNLSFLVGLKTMPAVLEKVLDSKGNSLNALICPGHVAAVMGSDYFRFVADHYGIPAVVCGFENYDIILSVKYLVKAASEGRAAFENLYSRCVRPKGNSLAKELMSEVFEGRNGYWRGIGCIENSELGFKKEFRDLDAAFRYCISPNYKETIGSCLCKDVIMGSITPFQCTLFDKGCSIEAPRGPCMVSSEGACAIYYKYKRSVV